MYNIPLTCSDESFPTFIGGEEDAQNHPLLSHHPLLSIAWNPLYDTVRVYFRGECKFYFGSGKKFVARA